VCARETPSKDGPTQPAGNADLHSTSGGVRRPPESKLQLEGVRRSAARHRAQARQELAERYGAERAVSPQCVTLCKERLAEIGIDLSCLKVRELVYLLQRVLHTTLDGAALPLSRFSSLGLGRKLLDGLLQVGLIWCLDPDSWKPYSYDIRNAKARRFLPTSELMLVASADAETVNSGAAYLSGTFGQREIIQQSIVQSAPDSGVTIPSHVTAQLEKGTGLAFNLNNALPILHGLVEERRARTLLAGQAALNWLGSRHRIHTSWIQKPTGRLYASRPAIVNLPSLLRPALRPRNGGVLCEVDFQNFEARILHSQAGIPAPAGDYAEFVGNKIGIHRDDVKQVLNPALHGQTQGNLIGTKEWEKLDNRIKVEKFLKREFPKVWETIAMMQNDHSLLQRRGAQVFFSAYERALKTEDLPAGIPLHDGWVFPAKDEAQVLRVKDVFEHIGSEMLGQPMPVKHVIWN
jgi:hypothetical protein